MTRRRLLFINLFELIAVWGIAIVQPLLGVFGSSAETFIANGITPHTIIPIAVAFCLIPPLLVWCVELALMTTAVVMSWFHRVVIGVCLAFFFAQIFKVSFGVTGTVLVAAVVVAVAIGLFAFLKVPFVHQWFRFLSVTPLLALALFVTSSPSGRYALDATGAASSAVKTDGSSIAFVMFDEFPLPTIINADGQIDKDRFPNFYRLSQISTWYRNYSTVAESTEYAVPVALSGNKPNFNNGPTVADYPNNLFTWLGKVYRMNVAESVTSLCPSNLCKSDSVGSLPSFATRLKSLGSQALDVMKQRIDPTKRIGIETVVKGVAANYSTYNDKFFDLSRPGFPTMNEIDARILAQPPRWRKWLTAISGSGCPCLNFIHAILPHQPWLFYPDGTAYTADTSEPSSLKTDWENSVRRQRQALQTQMADTLIGELLDRLESQDLLRTTELVVVADHGISFDAGYDRRFINKDYANYPGIMFPPLFVHKPGQSTGTITDVNIESIDLMSIVADNIGAKWPWKTDGVLPSERTGDRLTKKTMYFLPRDVLMLKKRPDKSITVDATEAQRKMFAKAHAKTPVADYLSPLYAGTPYDSLRGTTIATTISCGCTLAVDSGIKALNPQVYVTGIMTGDVKEGDWIVLAVDGKVSGLSPVFKRGEDLRIMSLLKSGDFTSKSSVVTAYKMVSGDAVPRSVEVR